MWYDYSYLYPFTTGDLKRGLESIQEGFGKYSKEVFKRGLESIQEGFGKYSR